MVVNVDMQLLIWNFYLFSGVLLCLISSILMPACSFAFLSMRVQDLLNKLAVLVLAASTTSY